MYVVKRYDDLFNYSLKRALKTSIVITPDKTLEQKEIERGSVNQK